MLGTVASTLHGLSLIYISRCFIDTYIIINSKSDISSPAGDTSPTGRW